MDDKCAIFCMIASLYLYAIQLIRDLILIVLNHIISSGPEVQE